MLCWHFLKTKLFFFRGIWSARWALLEIQHHIFHTHVISDADKTAWNYEKGMYPCFTCNYISLLKTTHCTASVFLPIIVCHITQYLWGVPHWFPREKEKGVSGFNPLAAHQGIQSIFFFKYWILLNAEPLAKWLLKEGEKTKKNSGVFYLRKDGGEA